MLPTDNEMHTDRKLYSADRQTVDHTLAQWPAIEPSPGFEQHVWRRIRASEAPVVWWRRAWNVWQDWQAWQPAYAMVCTLLLGAALGLAVSGWRMPSGVDSTDWHVLRTASLSGQYAGQLREGR